MPNRNETIAETLRALSSTLNLRKLDLALRFLMISSPAVKNSLRMTLTRSVSVPLHGLPKELTEGPKRIKGGYGIIDMSFKDDDGLDVPLYPDLKQQIDDLGAD